MIRHNMTITEIVSVMLSHSRLRSFSLLVGKRV